MAAAASIDPDTLTTELDELAGRVAARFPRAETRATMRQFVSGLLADLPTRNCWTISEPEPQIN